MLHLPGQNKFCVTLIYVYVSVVNEWSMHLTYMYWWFNLSWCWGLVTSVNIGHLESVIHILQQPFITGVSRVCKPVPLSSSQKLVRKADSGASSIYVDIVCCLNGKPVWFIVSDRNPKYITWHGSSANKGLRKRIQDVLQAAQSSETLRPSSLILFFSSGLDHIVHKKLQEEFGAADLELPFPCFDCAFFDEFEDEWINIVARSYQEACILEIEINSSVSIISTPRKECTVTQTSNLLSLKHVAVDLKLGDSFCSLVSGMNCCLPDSEIDQLKDLSCGHVQFVNFDTTALIAIVSGISNGGMDKLLATEESQLRNRFKGNYDFVLGQVNIVFFIILSYLAICFFSEVKHMVWLVELPCMVCYLWSLLKIWCLCYMLLIV